jgi:hypothetical protein
MRLNTEPAAFERRTRSLREIRIHRNTLILSMLTVGKTLVTLNFGYRWVPNDELTLLPIQDRAISTLLPTVPGRTSRS